MDDEHFVAVIGIIRKGDKILLCKRCHDERSYPSRWCLPGGKIDREDFVDHKKDTSDHWFDILENVLKREIKEETGLIVKNLRYLSSAVSLRKNGHSYIVITFISDLKGGEVSLDPKELDDFRWVSHDEIDDFDIISNDKAQLKKSIYSR